MYNKNQSPIINIELRSILTKLFSMMEQQQNSHSNEYFTLHGEKYNFCDKCELTICNSMQHNEFISYDLES